jgi:hypothetical protein
VLPRRDFLTKEACRLLRGGKDMVDRDGSLAYFMFCGLKYRGIMQLGNGRSFRWWRTPFLGSFEQRFLGVRVYYFAT